MILKKFLDISKSVKELLRRTADSTPLIEDPDLANFKIPAATITAFDQLNTLVQDSNIRAKIVIIIKHRRTPVMWNLNFIHPLLR